MYKRNFPQQTTMVIKNNSTKGETIEQKVRRILNNQEPIKDGASIQYTERKDGVRPEHDPRTDKWDLSLDKIDSAVGNHLDKRELRQGEQTYDTMSDDQQKAFNKKYPKNKHASKNTGKEAGGQSTQATE